MRTILPRIALLMPLLLLLPISADQTVGLDGLDLEAAALAEAQATGLLCPAESLLGESDLSMGPPSGCKGRFCDPVDAQACQDFCSSGGCGISLATCQDGECHCFCSGCL